MKNFVIIVISLLAFGFSSCSCGGSGENISLLPNISGKAGEVVVVTDMEYWNGSVGEAFYATLGANYPAIPQDEGLFSFIKVPAASFTRIFRIHRNIVTVEISPEYTEAELVIKNDVWARQQIVLGFVAPDTASLVACVLENKERMVNALEQIERDRTVARAERYEDKNIRMRIEEVFGGSPCIPVRYKIRRLTDNFAWMQLESAVRGKYMFQAVFVYKYPYKDSTSFSLENIIRKRNEILQKEVPGAVEGSYMTTSDAIQPMMRSILYRDLHFTEVRGLWEVENDFQGGPFISHTFLDKEGENIICLEAIVYAPSFDKRNFIRQTEGIIYTFKWKQDEAKK